MGRELRTKLDQQPEMLAWVSMDCPPRLKVWSFETGIHFRHFTWVYGIMYKYNLQIEAVKREPTLYIVLSELHLNRLILFCQQEHNYLLLLE